PRTRRHTQPTLLPYTTLFRSIVAADGIRPTCRALFGDSIGRETVEVLRARIEIRVTGQDLPLTIDENLLGSQVRRHPGLIDSLLDRKSTRLNSSHQIISYAVF